MLEDIHRRTGLRFRQLGSIDRNDRAVIERVLPIAREWVPLVGADVKSGLYFLFLSRFAAPYIDDISLWARSAADKRDRDLLAQILNVLISPKTAERIWELFRTLEPNDFDPLLLATFARMPKTTEQALARIMDDLRSFGDRIARGDHIRSFNTAAFTVYSRLKDSRVREWFSQYVHSSDPDLRALARWSVRRRKGRLPASCHILQASPDIGREVYSTEIDAGEWLGFLHALGHAFGIRFPSEAQMRAVFETLSRTQWVVMDVSTSDKGPLEVWFREEDEATLEIRILRPYPGTIQ